MNLQKRSASSSFVAFHVLVLAFLLLITAVSARLVIQEEYLFNDDEETTTTKVWSKTENDLRHTWKDINKIFEEYKHSLNGIKDSVGKGIKQGLNLGNNKAGGDWGKILTHEDFPDYDIRLKEPKLCDLNVRQYSGYLDSGEKKHFFFWFFESRNDPANDPIVLWLNGGPGCSSLTGLFFELGPCIVNAEGTDTIPNPYSWNNNATVIFLDQPMNVGYSHGTGVSDTLAAAKDVYAFLQIFFKQFPQYAELDFHIAGESYAGHYIPAIAAQIHDNNEGTSAWIQSKKPKHLKHINLESILIGNGLVDPLVQYKYYPEMACNSSYGPVLDEAACDKMRNAYSTCSRLINNCYNSQNVFNCFPASLYCNREIIGPYQETGKNPYDVRKKCKGNSLCYPILSTIEAYLNNETVKAELGAEVEEYKSCNMEINFRFQIAGDWMRPYHRSIPPLLKDDIRVLIYAGDADFICNWFGNRAWVKELEWHGKEGYNEASVRDWILEDGSDEIAGTVQSHQGLTFLRIYKAGHMTPYDQPNASLDFFNRWIQKRKL